MKEDYKEYNLLTKRLLEEGYSAEHHPDYVRVDVPMWQEKTLDNYYGGFTYERWWTFENDMATIRCPYEKKECKMKHEILQENKVLRYECEVHMTEEEYCYEGSVEHILKLHDDEIWRQEISFGLQRNGRVCQEHMRFNRDTLEWEMNYDPYHCGLRGCTGMCPIFGHELDKKRGNVFYDVKISYLRNDLNGTLFEGQVDTQIIKGKKLFDHPVSMDICKICARLCQDRIKDKMRTHYFTQLFFSEYYGRYFSFEIQNVRAGQRESRDLMQDLEDIRNGIQIIHASDAEKRNKGNRKERRQKLRESAIRRLEKKLLEKEKERNE